MIAVLLDLDQTLIDSRKAETFRRRREWSQVYQLIPQLLPYQGVNELLFDLSIQQIPTAIVTSSPKTYCFKVIEHWEWSIKKVIAYHDTKEHKPHPEPIIKALELLNKKADQAIYVGDSDSDIISSQAAGVTAIRAMWGVEANSQQSLSKAQYNFFNVLDLNNFIKTILKS